jgi:hypothetical protein
LGTPNAFATIVLLAFLPLTLVAFWMRRTTACAVALLLASLMFMPARVEFDFVGLPGLDKLNLPYLYLLIATLVFAPQRLRGIGWGRAPDLFLGVLLLGAIPTTMTNRDPLLAAKAMSNYDILSVWAADLLMIGIPFVLGRAFLRSTRDLETVLRQLVAAALGYSLLCLIEIRLSPQLHNWVYGFHQEAFSTTVRLGGWRPAVFMANGMAVGVFFASALVAAVTLRRAGGVSRNLSSRASIYLAFMLVLVKSSAAIIYGATLAPAMAWLEPRRQRLVLLSLLVVVVSYPAARLAGIMPTGAMVSAAASVDANRAQSLEFRFQNEDKLLAHALERPWFGWGSFGRNMIYDLETLKNVSVTDGYWIIAFGRRGIVGWAAIFALALWPVLLACSRAPNARDPRERTLLLGAATIVMIHVIDWLPNGLFTNLAYFLTGGLWSASRALAQGRRAKPRRGRGRAARPRPGRSPSPPSPAAPVPAPQTAARERSKESPTRAVLGRR